mmetsp:Transcript_100797/g.289692  ORF Transcript_100797/g.289692 Transcript_100797/m.289692 type:complete len:125 (-) Transcript_100797:1256-1630(-)
MLNLKRPNKNWPKPKVVVPPKLWNEKRPWNVVSRVWNYNSRQNERVVPPRKPICWKPMKVLENVRRPGKRNGVFWWMMLNVFESVCIKPLGNEMNYDSRSQHWKEEILPLHRLHTRVELLWPTS